MKRIRMRKKLHKFILTVSIVFLAFFVWQTFEIIAKYYASQNNKGVAVSSGLYFNSDKLKKIQGDLNPTAIDENHIYSINDAAIMDEIKNLIISTNATSWSAGSVDIPIKIQNYDSNILYNEPGLDISYRIEFKLSGDPIGAKYEIVGKDGNTKFSLDSNGSTCQFEEKLVGGSLQADSYQIRITLTENKDNYKPAQILVLAYPTAPDYLVKTKEQPYRLLGRFEGRTTDMKLEIDSAAFLVENDINEDAENNNLIEVLNNSVAYIYNIKTKGDMVQNVASATKREITVKWRSDYLSLDRYNEYYKEAMSIQGSYGSETDGNGVYWDYIKIKILPYANINLTFYKNEEFINAVNAGNGEINSKEAFHNLVKVELDTDESTEPTPETPSDPESTP